MMRAGLLLPLMFWLTTSALAQHRIPWDIGPLTRDQQATTNVSVTNRCLATHLFELRPAAQMTWFSFTGEPRVRLAPGETGSVPARIDTAGLEMDLYPGEISVVCLDCASEPGCASEVLETRLKVGWSTAELESFSAQPLMAAEVLVTLAAQSAEQSRRIARELGAAYQLQLIREFELRALSRRVILFALPDPQVSVSLAVSRLQADTRVRSAQPNFLYTTLDSARPDQYASLQFGPPQIKADLARQYATGKGVRIAILDTGIDDQHEDLAGRIIEKENFVPGAREFRQDIHGTLVAGIIAARPDNGTGIYGVAPDARIIAVKVCRQKSGQSGAADGATETLWRGMDFAILKSADIINLSLGRPGYDEAIAGAVRQAVARGIVVVAAAGNGGEQGKPCFPAALEEVIAVSAIDSRDALYQESSRGNYIDLAAPGVEIISTLPGNRYNVSSGTSMAAPHVTGVVALLLEKNAGLPPAGIKALLEATARDLGVKGRDIQFGSGCVDARQALSRLTGHNRRSR
jgi:subtilisin family serine protease